MDEDFLDLPCPWMCLHEFRHLLAHRDVVGVLVATIYGISLRNCMFNQGCDFLLIQ